MVSVYEGNGEEIFSIQYDRAGFTGDASDGGHGLQNHLVHTMEKKLPAYESFLINESSIIQSSLFVGRRRCSL
jgi:hypothetical protein